MPQAETPSNTPYGQPTTVYFSDEMLKNNISLFRVHPTVMKAQRGSRTLISFYRTKEDVNQVVMAQTADRSKGAMSVKRDVKSFEVYDQPVAHVTYQTVFDTFNDNKEIINFLKSVNTVKDAQDYFPNS